ESQPGPNSFSGSSGKLGSTSFQDMTLPSEAGSHIFLSWSAVRHLAQVFSLFTTTVSASTATGSWAVVMPLASQAAFSSSLIGREASEMSVSPLQNFSKPPPVPDVATVTLTLGCCSAKSSAAAVDRGATVLEPSILTDPLSSDP